MSVSILCAPAIAWAAGALHFDLPAPPLVRSGAALLWTLAAVALLLFTRPLRRGLLLAGLGFGAILGWWLTIRPRQDRDWRPEVAVLAHADVEGDAVTFHDVRDFEHRSETDFTPRYVEKHLHLDRLRGLDVFLCYWGSELMAHPLLSFDFGADGRICFSIEARKERGEGYATLRSLYRGFELIYVVAEERDVVRLRSSIRSGEDVYLYRILEPPESVRELFLTYVRRVNELYVRPEFYNALTANCTTSIRLQRSPERRVPFDYRMILNGRADELLYELGKIDRGLPFAELRRRAHVDRRAGDAPDFSARIRSVDAGGGPGDPFGQ